MRNALHIAFVLSGLLVSTRAFADEACVELIRHAVYDHALVSSDIRSYQNISNNFCQSDDNFSSSNPQANTGGNYGIIGGYGNFSDEQKHTIHSAMCDANHSIYNFSSTQTLLLHSLNPNALHVIDDCIKAASLGVRLTVEYPTEDSLSVSIVFLAPPGDHSTYRKINRRITVDKSIRCTGDLADAHAGTHITVDAINMTCSRVGPFTPIKIGDRQFVHMGGLVDISTSVGPLIALMPKKPDPNYVPPPPPHKAVVADCDDLQGHWSCRRPEGCQIEKRGPYLFDLSNGAGHTVMRPDGRSSDGWNVDAALPPWSAGHAVTMNNCRVVTFTNYSTGESDTWNKR